MKRPKEQKPNNLLIAAQTFTRIRPGKIFLEIDFLLIAMKSKKFQQQQH